MFELGDDGEEASRWVGEKVEQAAVVGRLNGEVMVQPALVPSTSGSMTTASGRVFRFGTQIAFHALCLLTQRRFR
jgi:hypothetical protein